MQIPVTAGTQHTLLQLHNAKQKLDKTQSASPAENQSVKPQAARSLNDKVASMDAETEPSKATKMNWVRHLIGSNGMNKAKLSFRGV
ncbi:hypothetical protein Poli38472_008363 [Pythium oligandrum]|uniref:Uncharacterized protein n=1 Tax=Pythium oligandrum TaxID=41045 RepID=A0A8K1CLA3_PYTOL|nr:hypothetical protein Poli38472_008363 [Pythium oligandrum]|eukprot:TMW65721.1 hypothetical protein Poli38472_008363 [Pythium oligandrum]